MKAADVRPRSLGEMLDAAIPMCVCSARALLAIVDAFVRDARIRTEGYDLQRALDAS